MKLKLIALALLLAPGLARAEETIDLGLVPVGPANPFPVYIAPNSPGASSNNPIYVFGGGNSLGAPVQTTGVCGVSSSVILAAGSAVSSMSFHLPGSATNPIWLNVSGNAAVMASPAFDLQPGQTITFSTATGLLPTTAVTCIAASSTNVTEIYK